MHENIHQTYIDNGHAFTKPVYHADELARVNEAMDAVLRGEYETGVPPFHQHVPEHLTQPLVKIDNAQLANRTILAFLSDTRFGQWAGRVSGAQRVQIWSTQMLVKRPTAGDSDAAIGWHRDETYWRYWTPDSELFTAWIAISDVQLTSGPMCMVPGSHKWPDAAGGNFFGKDMAEVKASFSPPSEDAWTEVPIVLPPGAISFHDKRAIHGSYANTSNAERRSFAVHMRTENSQLRDDVELNQYIDKLDDPNYAPVIWDANNPMLAEAAIK